MERSFSDASSTVDSQSPPGAAPTAGDAAVSPAPSLAEAEAYCRQLARSHYENFSVASLLLPRQLRQHFYHVYAYCRSADDLADESGDPQRSIELLDAWESDLLACYRGEARHPVFVALMRTIDQFDIPPQPFLDLLVAFRQDQRQTRYATFDDLTAYCRNSACPVGRLVLYLGRCHRPELVELSDSICIGLQLANFWQDVARDHDIGRIYLPQESCRQHGYDRAMLESRTTNDAFRRLICSEVDRAEQYLRAGLPLAEQVPAELSVDVALFARGGLAVLDAIRRIDYDVWRVRPTVSKTTQLRLLAGCWWSNRSAARRAGLPQNASLPESYAYCAQAARRSASNFYYSFYLLPRDQRRSMNALYSYLRKTDDIGDSLEPTTVRRKLLAAWRALVEAALAGTPIGPILPALADTVHRFQIPTRYLLDVIDGVEMDLDPQGFETFEDLEVYCHRVASAVGLACIHIWGFDGDAAAVAAARKCGLAFQMTNILRDLKEDAAVGRVYLPREDLRRFDCTEDDLARGVFTDELRHLLRFEIERTEQFYREASGLGPHLKPAGRRAWGAMTATYHRLLEDIRARDGDVFSSRPRLGMWNRLQIAVRWALPRPRLRESGASEARASRR